jgi:sodium transport system permease protein
MTSPSEPRTPRLYHARDGSAFTPIGALALLFAAMGTLLAVGTIGVAVGAPLYAALALGQLGMLAVPWLAARRTGRGRAALGLARPPGRFVIAAALIGASAWYLNLRLVELLQIPEGDMSQLEELVARPALPIVLATVAVAPAICEEVLFRGVLLRALATRLPAYGAVLVSAALFSLYHIKPIQMLPTFTLGALLAVIALRARSIVPTMLAHLLNNAIALIIARDELEPVSRALASNPYVALAGFAACFAFGVAIAVRGER